MRVCYRTLIIYIINVYVFRNNFVDALHNANVKHWERYNIA